MLWTLLLLAIVIVLLAAYRVRAAWSPFTHRGHRRGVHWARSWWSGDQAQNRDER